MKRIPSLDGLRAISIGLVLLAHLSGSHGFPIAEGTISSVLDVGNLGVRVFFVISGFLITGLLLRELDSTGTISLSGFYGRRTARIFPAYYAYLAVVALCAFLGWVELGPHDLAHALTYTQNYNPGRAWVLGHAWSLSVEEQFYLLWPAVLLIGGRHRALRAALSVIALAPLARLGSHFLPHPWGEIGHTFETTADALAAGCLLAFLRDRLWRDERYRRFLQSRLFLLVPVAVLAAGWMGGGGRPRLVLALYHLVGVTIMNVGIALCADWCIRFPDRAIGRVLNWRPMVFVGVLSYSLYLWQQPFLNRTSAAAWTRFPVNIVLVVVAALVSYYAVERPGLALRQRFTERRRVAAVPA